jgi:hypothetical protein
MGKKGNQKEKGKKLTKKEKKRLNHLKLMQGKKDKFEPVSSSETHESKKKAA